MGYSFGRKRIKKNNIRKKDRMIEKQIIKGEYYFTITITTMFHNHTLNMKEHNLITNNGIQFFLNKALYNPKIIQNEINDETTYEIDDDYGIIGYVGVGTNNEPAQVTDNHLTNETVFYDTKTKIEDNKIILTVNTTGENIDGTSEIGVYTTKNILISHDVHTTYVVPTSATIKLEYIFTFNQEEE